MMHDICVHASTSTLDEHTYSMDKESESSNFTLREAENLLHARQVPQYGITRLGSPYQQEWIPVAGTTETQRATAIKVKLNYMDCRHP